MTEDYITILSALVGAVIGSIGSTLISILLSRRAEKRRSYQNLVQKYLLYLQDSIESLLYRFQNIKQRGGEKAMKSTYYEPTTLYALAKVLALKHILATEGVYSSIENVRRGLGTYLRNELETFDKNLDKFNWLLKTSFYRYERQLLAETVLEKEEQSSRISSFLNFRKGYNDKDVITLLAPARQFVSQLDKSAVSEIMEQLYNIVEKLEPETGVRAVFKKDKELENYEDISK
jgi:hypothetical protein